MLLHVRVDVVFWPKPDVEGEFFIFSHDKGKAKGKMAWRPEENERLILDGKWVPDRGGGKIFAFESAQHDIPISSQDQLHYVCEQTAGVGIAMEEQIWNEWGECWWDEIKPGVIRRLAGKLYEDLRQTMEHFLLKKEETEAVAWLMGQGATLNLAQTAWKRWEKGTIGVVQSNCYTLAELPNHGFHSVDKSIRYNFGIEDNDPRRITAGIQYSMGRLTNHGSTVISWAELYRDVSELLKGMYGELISSCVVQMFEDGTLRQFSGSQSLSLGKDFENEQIIWDFVSDGKIMGESL